MTKTEVNSATESSLEQRWNSFGHICSVLGFVLGLFAVFGNLPGCYWSLTLLALSFAGLLPIYALLERYIPVMAARLLVVIISLLFLCAVQFFWVKSGNTAVCTQSELQSLFFWIG
ncbi:hypothetical protein [Ruegeria sp. HKCCA0370]|uniref:hypothetical protein n=1 Tax=Ruegeria sp. HKCCA0370 TaxID=2682995 RepID=UPI001488EF21|nr:hypothetical protein [Ruegeria sp. HKCCA0370]